MEELMGNVAPNVTIAILCLVAGGLLSSVFADMPRVKAAIPWILALVGGALGALQGALSPLEGSGSLLSDIAMGCVSGLASVGLHEGAAQPVKKKYKNGQGQDVEIAQDGEPVPRRELEEDDLLFRG